LESVWQSPGYPAPTVGTLLCQYDLHIQPGTCKFQTLLNSISLNSDPQYFLNLLFFRRSSVRPISRAESKDSSLSIYTLTLSLPIRLDFKEFNTSRPLDRGLCHMDQFLILNSLDGPAFPRCGELSGYSSKAQWSMQSQCTGDLD